MVDSFDVENGTVADVRAILAQDRDAFFSARDRRGRSFFFNACLKGRTPIVKALLAERGVDVNCAGAYAGTVTPAIGVAAAKGYLEVLELLLSSPGIEIDEHVSSVFSSVRSTALVFAVREGHFDCASALVRHGAVICLTGLLSSSPCQPVSLARSRGTDLGRSFASYLEAVDHAGGFRQFHGEPRVQLVLLRTQCERGYASVTHDSSIEAAGRAMARARALMSTLAADFASAAAEASSTALTAALARGQAAAASLAAAEKLTAAAEASAKRRRLYEWLFDSAPLSANNDGGGPPAAKAARHPRAAAPAPRPALRFVIEFLSSGCFDRARTY
jgi:hypothetical protein